MNAPDYAEPIVGWRLWHVAEREGALRLVSPLYRTPWPPRGELRADCRRGLEPGVALYPPRRRSHSSPDPLCGCGVYGSRSPGDAAAYMTRFFKSREDVVHRVLGTVSLWGEVVECETGWRAARAYPRRIFVPLPRGRLVSLRGLRRPALSAEAIALALADYGVPIELVECGSLDELAEIVSQPIPGARAA